MRTLCETLAGGLLGFLAARVIRLPGERRRP